MIDLFDGSAFAQSLVHDKMPLAGGGDQHFQQLFFGFLVEVLGPAQAAPAGFQAADGFLEGFLVGLADAHDLAYGPHLCPQFVLHAFEFFKGPAGKLDYHIISVRNVFVQSAVFSAGDVLQSQAGGQHGGNQGDGEAGGFGSQGGRPGSPGIDLDDHDPVCCRVMGELHVSAADDLYGFHDPVGLLLQTLLAFLGNSQHGSGAEGISGMYAQGINVFDKADSDHIVVRVPDHFQLQLFPAQNGLFHQHLTHQAGLEASGADGLQLFPVVDQAAAGTAHGVGGTQHDRVAQLVSDGQSLLHAVGHLAAGHFNAQSVHGFFKLDAVLPALNGVHLHADDLHMVFIQDSLGGKLRAEIQPGLASQVGKQGVGPLLGDNLFQPLYVQRLNVSHIRGLRVGHNGGRVGIDQHDLVAQLLQGLAGLSAGIIKFTGLADDNGAGTDDKHFVNVCSLWHFDPPEIKTYSTFPTYYIGESTKVKVIFAMKSLTVILQNSAYRYKERRIYCRKSPSGLP